MEDFDYIDALAKSELSNRTGTPSVDGWNNIQQKMKRKKHKRFFVYFLLFVLVASFGIYQAINFNTDVENNAITNKNNDSNSNSTSISSSDSTSNSTSTSGQTETNTLATPDATRKSHQHQTANTVKSTQKNDVNMVVIMRNSNVQNRNRDGSQTNTTTFENKQLMDKTDLAISQEDSEISAEATGLKLYPWELITPESLKKKREKQAKKEQEADFYENLDLMVGLNGFFTPNDYEILKSYVVEVSYTQEKKLKNNYFFNYGMALQFRNLHFKKDSISFNRGEVSLNFQSNIEKRFGNFGIEAGAYLGYELYSPNNDVFSRSHTNFFEQKINYGLATSLKYKKIGLVFKYELSPFINSLGKKKNSGFIIGIKYDF